MRNLKRKVNGNGENVNESGKIRENFRDDSKKCKSILTRKMKKI